MAKLPVVKLGGVEYFVDSRLWELREVHNPHLTREMTCKTCDDKYICQFAGDLYNLDGQCLAMK